MTAKSDKQIEKLGREIAKIDDERSELNKKDSELSAKRSELQNQLLDLFDEQGINTDSVLRIDGRPLKVNETDVPTAKDWDKVYNFMQRNKAQFLLEKRISSKVYREMLQQRGGRPIPGIESYTKRTITVGKVPKPK